MYVNGYLIALLVFIVYIAIVIFLWRSGLGKRMNLSFIGPLLMIRTQKGIDAVRRISRPRRFWKGYATVSWAVFVAGMISMLLLLLWEAVLVLSIPKSSAPSVQSYLLIPGINPFVPLGYGLVAIIVAVVLHELSHGVLSESQDIDVRSMGVLMLIVPIGAFVEPDQQMLEETETRKRIRIFGAGPGTNMFLALLFLVLFIGPFMGASSPAHPGLAVVSMPQNSLAAKGGIQQWSEILAVNGTAVTHVSQFYSLSGLQPGRDYPVQVMVNGKVVSRTVPAGVEIAGTVPGSPAAQEHIQPGWIVLSMNNTTVINETQFAALFNSTVPGQTVPFVFLMENGSRVSMDIKLTSASAVEGVAPSAHPIGFLGIYFTYMGVSVIPEGQLLSIIRDPFYGYSSSNPVSSILGFLVQPFEGLSPIPSGLALNLHAYGSSQGQLFWIGANGMYWLFWINLWVGLFNMLPAVPLDGGYLFRDNIRLLLSRFSRRNAEERESIARGITTAFSYLVFLLIIWQLVAIRFI